jgi:hypothetical protein
LVIQGGLHPYLKEEPPYFWHKEAEEGRLALIQALQEGVQEVEHLKEAPVRLLPHPTSQLEHMDLLGEEVQTPLLIHVQVLQHVGQEVEVEV